MAMLPASVATSGTTQIASAASAGATYLVSAEGLFLIKIILFLFAGFFVFDRLWHLLKKDQS